MAVLRSQTSACHGSLDQTGCDAEVNVNIAGDALLFLTLNAVTTCAHPSALAPRVRNELGPVPAFHPELDPGPLPGYLAPQDVPDSIALIPPPPAPGSAALAHDEEVARGTFALRYTARFALAASDFDLRITNLVDTFECALNTQIPADRAPYLETLLRRAFSDLALSTHAARTHYKRTRPFVQNHEPIGVPEARGKLEGDPSYPSEHAAVGWGVALILSELAPDRADELLARGRAFEESPSIANYHWHSDVVWGGFMGAATVSRLHTDPTFREDMQAARAELSAVRAEGIPPKRNCRAEATALAPQLSTRRWIAVDVR
jgi:acid phosphatase (class A)